MDPRLLRYYERELQFARESGAEFAEEYPKIAARLSLDGLECSDPYVERLLEGFAFLSARVQLKLDAEFPRLTQHLLESLYPSYLAPTPSMAVVQMQPDLGKGTLAAGPLVPRGTAIRTPRGKAGEAPCEYRTAHDVRVWPIEIVEAAHVPYSRELGGDDAAALRLVRAALRLRLRALAGASFETLPIEDLPLFLAGTGDVPARLYEHVMAATAGVLVRSTKDTARRVRLPAESLARVGFSDDEALLPYGRRSFQGHRLLHEYFAMPERFRFFELRGLREALAATRDTEIEIIVLLSQNDPSLHNRVDASHFALHTTPAINLFPMSADPIHLTEGGFEHHVVPDRARPMDFEVWDVVDVEGLGTNEQDRRRFAPLYAVPERTMSLPDLRFFTTHRVPHVLPPSKRHRARSTYVGSEVFLSLVDAREAPWPADLKQLTVKVRCTNRDLPYFVAMGQSKSDFTFTVDAPVASVRCLSGPTDPAPSFVLRPDDPSRAGEIGWRLVNQLSLNYLSIVDAADGTGAASLRELLRLYVPADSAPAQNQIAGVRSVSSRPVVRRIHGSGPLAFGRGLEVTVTLDESAFTGASAFLLGAVLDELFARHVSINSFVETHVATLERGEIARWPARGGRRHTL